MSIARLVLPPIAGASFSLAFLYLYHQATLSRHDTLQDAVNQAKESLEEAESKVRDKFSGRSRTPKLGQSEDHQTYSDLGGKSRWQEKRYQSIADEIKERWNYHLLHLPDTVSRIEPDHVILTTFSTISQYAHATWSRLTSTSAGDDAKGDAKRIAEAVEGMSLRSREEIQRKLDEIKD